MVIQSLEKKPIGETLVAAGLISLKQVELALRDRKKSHLRLGEIIVARGWLKRATIEFFCEQWSEIIQTKPKKSLVYYLRRAELINNQQIKSIIQLQKRSYPTKKFYHLLVEQGYLRQVTIDFFLANLFNVCDPRIIPAIKPYAFLKDYAKGITDFVELNLAKAPLNSISVKGVTLDKSSLREAHLRKANISNSSLIRVNLSFANLTKAIFTDVNLTKSYLIRTNLRRVHLVKVNFQSAILHNTNWEYAYLSNINFSGADLTKAELSFIGHCDNIYYDRKTIFDSNFDPQSWGWIMLDRDS